MTQIPKDLSEMNRSYTLRIIAGFAESSYTAGTRFGY